MATQSQKDILANNLKKFLDIKGISQTDLAKTLDYPEMTVSNWVNAKFYPRIDKIQELADFFEINKSDLIEDKTHKKYDEINLNKIPGIIPIQKARRIPILGTIACGPLTWSEENFEGYFVADLNIKGDFCLKAKGDSMIGAGIYDGDFVFLRKTPDVDSGKIAAVRIQDETTLKKVIKTENAVILQPCNDSYPPIILDENSDALIVGEMIGIYHTFVD